MNWREAVTLAVAVVDCGGGAFSSGSPADTAEDAGSSTSVSATTTTTDVAGTAGSVNRDASRSGSGGSGGIPTIQDAGKYVDCTGIGDWNAFDVSYSVGDLRVHMGKLWRCDPAIKSDPPNLVWCRSEPGANNGTGDVGWGISLGPCDPTQGRD